MLLHKQKLEISVTGFRHHLLNSVYSFDFLYRICACESCELTYQLACCPLFAANATAVTKAKAVPSAKKAESSSEDSSDDSDSEEEEKPAKVSL